MNAAQIKHLVGTLRAVALTQLVAFGYNSFIQGNWFVVIASAVIMIFIELFCLFLLRGIKDEKS